MPAMYVLLVSLVSVLAGCATVSSTALRADPPPTERVVATWRLHAGRVWFHATAATERPARQAIRQIDLVRNASGRWVEVSHPDRADCVDFTLFGPGADILQQLQHGPVDFSIRADAWNGAAVPLPDTVPDGTYRFIARVGYEVDGLETPELFGVIERKHGVWQRANGPVRSETPAGGDFID